MADRVKVNYIINQDTEDRLADIAERTHRTKGMVIDWLVEEKYEELGKLAKILEEMPVATEQPAE